MPQMRIRDAAAYLGVSDDTVRRWVSNGTLKATVDLSGRQVVDGYEVALAARERASSPPGPAGKARSGGNRFVGLVTDIQAGPVMARVEVQCGPFSVVSLMSSEAVHDLGLELGCVAVAAIESTNVVIATPRARA